MGKLITTVGNPLIMGATKTENGINFSVAAVGAKTCSLILYRKGTTDILDEIEFTDDTRFGCVYSMFVMGIAFESVDYNFSVDGKITGDTYAMALNNRDIWGKKPENVTCSIINHDDFDWKNDKKPEIDFSGNVIYRLHVRGFTMGAGSGARHKGTYKGIIEKIPYLKKLGINMVELMPAYDFYEVAAGNEADSRDSYMKYAHIEDGRINCWGYTEANYFAPKSSFSCSDTPHGAVWEFKELVAALHKNGIEISMEFYFTHDKTQGFVVDCLRHWVMNYHIDGIHINCKDSVMEAVEKDPILSGTKLFSYGFNENGSNGASNVKRLGIFNDDFMIAAKKFLKGDEDMVSTMSQKIKFNPSYAAVVNYIANHNTFTLADMVSYERKHNEPNGEGNRDGNDYNYSWNCGEEGVTRKKKVLELRKKQIKNALALVLLSQGTPMIYAGDERGNSNQGNNNPYCQDNEMSWVNWTNNSLSKEILKYTKFLIEFRKEHKILHMEDEFRMMDYKSLGYPDISYHSSEAWYSDFYHVNRQFAVMYCGKYADDNGDIYVAYNMHWEDKKFGVPAAMKGKKWEVVFTTNTSAANIESCDEKYYILPGRSIAVLISK